MDTGGRPPSMKNRILWETDGWDIAANGVNRTFRDPGRMSAMVIGLRI